MKKITVLVTARLHIHADESADVEKVLDEMEYAFTDSTGEADIVDSEIVDYNVEDAR